MRSASAAMEAAATEPVFARWCHSRGKRAMDLLCGVPVLAVALPFMAIVAAAVRLSSPGPVLFRQRRVGRNGQEFEILKFRTMAHRAGGLGITARGDARVTAVGRLLRNSKLDELPQLFNLVAGEMSLVGPRPDLAEFMATLPAAQRPVLALRPGMTGRAALQFRHEEELLAGIPPERLREYYIQTLLPQKMQLELDYARTASLRSDLAILLRTALAIVH